MLPVVAIVGRPNVGKSTLFNQLTRTRDALVADQPGVTRDRQYHTACLNERDCILIDTGGMEHDDEFQPVTLKQTQLAIQEADLVVLMVDARAGLTAIDETITQRMRLYSKPILVVVNKIDGFNPDERAAEFASLGFKQLYLIAAGEGRGVRQLATAIAAALPSSDAPEDAPEDVPEDILALDTVEYSEGMETTSEDELSGQLENIPENTPKNTPKNIPNNTSKNIPENIPQNIKVALIGRPNAGKSTLVNRLLGEERVVVFDQPGTTRDSIFIPFVHDDQAYTLIDTAGVRRQGRVARGLEQFSVVQTLQAVHEANVVVFVVDARENIADQDLHLLRFVLDAGRGLVIAINKWDGLSQDQRETVKTKLDRRLHFVDFVQVHFISALHGSGVGKLYPAINEAYHAAMKPLSTPDLTRLLQRAVAEHAPPWSGRQRIKLRYAHAGGHNPPTIVIHGTQTEAVPEQYRRYLMSFFRMHLKLAGTAVRLVFKTGKNPYEDKKNELTDRQKQRRRRLMTHIKEKAQKRKK